MIILMELAEFGHRKAGEMELLLGTLAWRRMSPKQSECGGRKAMRKKKRKKRGSSQRNEAEGQRGVYVTREDIPGRKVGDYRQI